MNAQNVSNKFLPHLTKAQFGKQAKSKPGQTVVVDGKRMNTYSDEYEQAYNKGIGQWRKYDSKTGQWNLLPNNLPSSAYNDAEFVSSERDLPEVTVTAKMNPLVSAARKKAIEQAGALDAFKKREEASYPKWYKNTSLYNPQKDSQTQEETYNSVVNRGTYQNLVDAIPQRKNESRVNYINRFNNLAGKNAVSLARQANVTEPFDPSNLYKLGQWGWKGLNHIAAVNQAFSPSNTRGIMPTIQEGINRGNMPIPGMLPDEAKEVGITQPFDTVDDLAFRYGFKPALIAGDNLMDPAGRQARTFNSRYLGPSETDKVFTSLMNPLNYIAGAEIFKGAKGLSDAVKTPLRTVSAAQRNLKDLNYAKKVYGPLGYKIPENLERIAQSDLLTDRTVRGLVNRDNTFYRGVSNLEALKEKTAGKRPLFNSSNPMDTYYSLVDQLKKSGVDITNEEEVAKYMATHIPGETGAGRANLDNNIFKKGLDALYTSNSEGTAEGYTYGKGFIVKAKKPTDFSFSDRKSWIDYNNPDIQARDKYRLPFLSSKPITWKTDYKKLDDEFINNYREGLGAERLQKEYPDAFAFGIRNWENGSYPEVKKVFDRRDELRTTARENFAKVNNPLQDKIREVDRRIDQRVEKFKKSNMPMPVKFLQGITNPAFVRDMVLDQYYGNLSKKLRKSHEKEWMSANYIPYLERYPDLATAIPEVDPYAHYLHIGKPGQKVLEPVSLRKISPDIWRRTSRAHDGKYSRQATRREFGGAYDSAEYKMGGQPCYECGGTIKRFDMGGYYDCPDQEKDPVTGKCKAEVVRGRQAAAANKAANADMNAWAKQVASMDKEIAKQNAAQAAGQLSWDYDWTQSPVEKPERKAALLSQQQFFQQNPNVFIADDTSGYTPQQKYVIASKLKQRMSTPMGSKFFQQQFGVDPRFYDLQRIQSEMAPKMGGWNGMRNWLFNIYKQQGGEYNLPKAQWGQLVNPTTIAGLATLAVKAKELFGFNEPKIIRTPASAPKRLSIRDPRKIMMTTGKPLRPNSDLVSGEYDSEQLGNLLTEAKRRNMSYNDMMNLAAMGFQETKWGKSDDNIGHTKGDFGPEQDSYSSFINAYNTKMKDADRLKIKDEATRLQVYNGLGKIFPSTEADYHGFKMKKIYGVEVPRGGIDLRKNPLYGKQVMDIRDNVLKRNPEFMRYMDSTYRAPMPEEEFANGGPILDPRGQWAHPGKVTRIPGSDITMQGVNYPVYAKPNKGKGGMMYPGGNYFFPKADYVDEYPMMQKGGLVPIIVNNPKDPRLQAYRDSLDLYNRSMHNHKQLMRPDFSLSLNGGVRNPGARYIPVNKKNSDSYRSNDYKRTFKSDEKDGWLAYAEDRALLSKTPQPELKALNLKSTYNISKRSKIRPVKNVEYNYGEGPYGGLYETNMLFKKPVQPVEYKKIVETNPTEYTPEETTSIKRIKAETIGSERTPISTVPSLINIPKIPIQFFPTEKEVIFNEEQVQPEIEKIRNTPIKDLMERMRLNREENKFRRNIRKGIKNQKDCWYGKCIDEDTDITQAQLGGFIPDAVYPMMQKGGTAYVDSVLNANKHLNWVQRLYQKNPQTIQIPGQKGTSTHFMESGDGRVYPTVVQMPNGQLQYLGDKAGDYADSTKTYIQFPNDKQATRFGKMYKKGTGVLSGFKSGGQHGGLDRWFAEKWVDVKTGKACGRQEGEKRAGYPACRPSKRVNSQTPKTSSEMSSAEKAKFKASKTSSQRINYNHKRNK